VDPFGTDPRPDVLRVRQSLRPARDRAAGLHVLLFLATFLTTMIAYAWNISGLDILSYPAAILVGIPYAVALMAILFFHESGHYVLARMHGVKATLPYFIPLLLPFSFHFGTLGAFIRMRSLPPNRRALFDIGAAGPWGGFLIAVLAVIVGLHLSEARPLASAEGGLVLGDSLLFSWLTELVLGVDPQEVTVVLHPVALAGWFGFLLTSINLLPVGQLDGGHVAYAVFGHHHRWISRGAMTFLIVLGLGVWPYWFVSVILFVILGLDHPHPVDSVMPLDRRRVVGAGLTLAVLVLTFMPIPAEFVEPVRIPISPGHEIPVSVPQPPSRGLVFPL
jgi:membrane-associated protease RseP (regulator of RpoE activity)